MILRFRIGFTFYEDQGIYFFLYKMIFIQEQKIKLLIKTTEDIYYELTVFDF